MSCHENHVLHKQYICPWREEVTGKWRRLYNQDRYVLYYAPDIIWVIKSRRMTGAGHVACMGVRRGAYRVLVGKPEGERPHGRPRHRSRDNI
jgi:hypothetical protein